jgi:cystathionine beta-lyase/cystathionine gamma-synthase
MDSKVTTNLKTISKNADGTGTWFSQEVGLATGLVHAGVAPDPTTGAIITPIVQSTTFVQDSIAEYCAKGYSYTRTANPTVNALEERIAAVEGGAAATVYSTGMAATTAIISTLMSAGDHAIITNCSYGGTNRAARVFFTRMGMEFDFVDMRDVANIEKAIKPNTKMILTETPANPTLTLIDLPEVTKLCKPRGIVHVCDSTFATPVILRPIEHGVDVVLQSTTKYYDGHNMTVGGAVIAATKELDEKFRFTRNILGSAMSPQVAFLQLQTSKTMILRIRQQSETAHKVATFLEGHAKVERVYYPGLASFPQKALADKLHRGGLHGGMLWFEVRGGTESGRKLMDTVQRPWSLCENLGATESIITAPAVMTHANMLKEDREKVGITDGFVRVSCGIEDAADLISALKIALDKL